VGIGLAANRKSKRIGAKISSARGEKSDDDRIGGAVAQEFAS